jgi:hypothetical protein
MTDYTGPYSPQDQAQPSTTAVARDEAANVGQSAAEAGSHVAQTATDQARMVASETARQARDLLGEASGQAVDQASVQQQRAARQLRTVADELQEMAAKGGQSGVATEVAHQAAERIHGAASWLEQREPADLLQAVRDFARRRPGVFLASAAAVGLVAGRLTRGATAAARSNGQPVGSSQRSPREIPHAATIPGPPDPDWTTPMPGYPADTVSGTTTGTVRPGSTADAEPYYPVSGVPGPGAAGPADPTAPGRDYPARGGYQGSGYDEGIVSEETGFPDSGPETYRPGQQP